MNKILDPIVYWKLRAICADFQKSQITVVQAQDVYLGTQKKQKAILSELGFDPDSPNFTLDDDKLSITFPD
jgi:hypothetical protein